MEHQQQNSTRIKGLDVPEMFEPGDIIFRYPTVEHKATIASRTENQVVITFVFWTTTSNVHHLLLMPFLAHKL